MGVEPAAVDAAQRRIAGLWPELTERQRRLLLGMEARELGLGGVSALARVVGVSRSTVAKGAAEVDASQVLPVGRSRRPGGGRKAVPFDLESNRSEQDRTPAVQPHLDELARSTVDQL